MFCKKCGKEINDKAVICIYCGVSTGVLQKGTDLSDATMRMLLPIGRSGYAIAAGYLGLFSILLVPAPFALLFGILGVRDIKKNKDKYEGNGGMGRAMFGIIMGAINSFMLIVWIFLECVDSTIYL